jgi:hypothetical protein
MKKSNVTLTKEDFSFVCPLKTEDMKAVEGGYFCGKCDKKVHDVTNMSHEALATLEKQNNNLCVTIHKVAAVSLVLGLAACSSPEPLTGKIAPRASCDANITNPKNRLSPFSAVDKNKTLIINRIEEPQIAGGKMAPMHIPQIIGEPKPKDEK